MDKVLFLKLNRAIQYALLEQNKVPEAIAAFESYQNELTSCRVSRKEKELIRTEIVTSRIMFLNRLNNMADKYVSSSDWANALICYTYLFKFDSKNTSILNNYVKSLVNLKQYDLALKILDFIKEETDDINIYTRYADIYSRKNDYGTAIKYYNMYLSKKEFISAVEYNQLGHYYNQKYLLKYSDEDAEKSLECFLEAYNQHPKSRLYNKNIIIVAAALNKNDLVEKHWNIIKNISDFDINEEFEYSMHSMKIGNFEEYYKYYDTRFYCDSKISYPPLKFPEWRREDITDKSLLIHCEQGFGDTALMWGYLKLFEGLNGRIIIVVQDELYSLLEKNKPDWCELCAVSDMDVSKSQFDYQLPMMSIPKAFNLTPDNISVGEGYIKTDKNLTETLKLQYFNNDKLKVGISLWGSSKGNKTRDIGEEYIKLLDNIDNAELYLLNKGIDIDKFKYLKRNNVVNIAKDSPDFSYTASIIENCDIILTTDNCILNLAGAIGKKTFGLFNWNTAYRWFDLTGDDVVYFTCVKPFVNEKQNDWSSSLNKAIAEINSMSRI